MKRLKRKDRLHDLGDIRATLILDGMKTQKEKYQKPETSNTSYEEIIDHVCVLEDSPRNTLIDEIKFGISPPKRKGVSKLCLYLHSIIIGT